MPYAEVCVNSPGATLSTFSYRIPENLQIVKGQAVWVPFGRQILQGVVMQTGTSPQYPQTRDVIGAIDSWPLLSDVQLQLANWISDYYFCPLFQALSLMLPPSFERRSICFLKISQNADRCDNITLSGEEANLLGIVRNSGRIELKQLQKILGNRRAVRLVSRLFSIGLLEREWEIEKPRVSPKYERYVNLSANRDEIINTLELIKTRAPRQAAVLNYLLASPGPVAAREIITRSHGSYPAITALARQNIIRVYQQEISRRPLMPSIRTDVPAYEINQAQQAAISAICHNLELKTFNPFLLFGITGSGKTEVYLQILEKTIRSGKRAIVLVPEISLTPQTIKHFTGRFPGQVAVMHSRLSHGERFDQWREIKKGEYQVVIGPRSALFAPQPDLGLIVIDEEHEWSYKQDTSPRYHARDVALEMARLNQATLVLGSATPDIGSYHQASRGIYQLLCMPDRVTPASRRLPAIEIVDLREELKAGNLSIFSRNLQSSIQQCLANHQQVILFLNRRGGASFVQCRNCGHVITCRRCQVSLTYHPEEERLVCHQCNFRRITPALCPQCSSRRIKYLGLGTQSVAAETSRLFPQARILRWDSDTTHGKDAHTRFLKSFLQGEADILIGTQMIAKGLDFPGVSLVGVINADTDLNLPDFRAGERTFSLLLQVAGRAGRGSAVGRVIIQSYNPNHYVIQAVSQQDYQTFYNTEAGYRYRLKQPPFTRIIRLTVTHISDDFCRREAARLRRELADAAGRLGLAEISILGPAPAFFPRLRGHFRWHLLLKGHHPAELLANIELPQCWKVDVDPVGLE